MPWRPTILVLTLSAALPQMASSQEEPLLSAANSEEHGAYIVGSDNRPVYAFVTTGPAGDGLPPLESCGPSCLHRWPHVTAEDGEVTVGENLDQSLATTVEWEGKTLAVYDSLNLFYFALDTPGEDPAGQGIHTFGGEWFLIAPSGEIIETPEMEDIDQ